MRSGAVGHCAAMAANAASHPSVGTATWTWRRDSLSMNRPGGRAVAARPASTGSAVRWTQRFRMVAAIADGTVRGSLTAAGKEREFTAKPVAPAAIAGLYRAARDVKGEAVVMGWIVDEKHQVVGGCQSKKQAVALKPAKPLPPPPPPTEEPKAKEKQEAEESLIGQVELEPGVSLQGAKVTSATVETRRIAHELVG